MPKNFLIAWTAPSNNGGSSITGYDVGVTEVGVSGETVYEQATTGTSYTVTGLTDGTEYSVRVRAENGVGKGPWSTAVTQIAALAPEQVAGLSASGGDGTLDLSWSAPASDATITDYSVEYTPSGGSATTVLVGSAATSYQLTGLTNDTEYSVRVAAVSAAGTGAYSAAVTGTPGAVVAGFLFAWGSNGTGQFGDASVASSTSPVQIGTDTFTKVSAGETHTLALREDGILFSAGGNHQGQLGIGNTFNRTSLGSNGTSQWKDIAAGRIHSLAIRNDGSLHAWGFNASGQVGDGTTTRRLSPTQIGSLLWSSVAVPVSGDSSFGIAESGNLYAWGGNASGQLGDGSTTTRISPVQVGSGTWASVAAGNSHTLGISSDGFLFGWGSNASGQNGTGANRQSPAQVGTDTWIAVACGRDHSFGIKSDGTLWAWGRNDRGQLGLGDNANRSSPTQVGSDTWLLIGAGALNGYGTTHSGTNYGWGNSLAVGDGTSGDNRLSPVAISGSSWIYVTGGGDPAAFAIA